MTTLSKQYLEGSMPIELLEEELEPLAERFFNFLCEATPKGYVGYAFDELPLYGFPDEVEKHFGYFDGYGLVLVRDTNSWYN